MESISKQGKVFTGKFAEIAVKIGIAKPVSEESEPQEPEVKKNKGGRPKTKK